MGAADLGVEVSRSARLVWLVVCAAKESCSWLQVRQGAAGNRAVGNVRSRASAGTHQEQEH